jgi:DNA-binding transcriptional MerR regulator
VGVITADEPGTPGDDEGELTVDQLAARAGVTVRNVRAYSARGLLPPPRMVGRTGYYGREHVSRLLLVREMLAEGYSLAMIERTLSSAPPNGSSATLALHRALLSPWLPPEPEVITGQELAARAGVPEDPAVVDSLVELGLVERLDDAHLRVLDPALLTAGIQVLGLGVPVTALVAAQMKVTEHVREIARTYVQMFVDTRWQAWVDAGAPRDQIEEIQATVARLQPVAAQALLAAFRTEMAGTVQDAVAAALSRLAES